MKERIRVLRKRRRPGHTPPAHGEARRVCRTAPITGRQRGPVTVRQMTAPPETTSAGPPHGACSSRQHFSEHGRQIPQSSLHGLDTFGERGAVLESAAIRGQNRGCVWKDYPVSGETGNHCHKRLANYYQVMRLIPHEPSNETMKPTPIAKQFSVFAMTPRRGLSLSR
jgi:hypothetical protein